MIARNGVCKSVVLASALLGCLCFLVAMAGDASAAVVIFREGGGSSYINTQMDGVSINPPSDTTAPDYFSATIRISGSPAPPTVPSERFFVLLAFKDLTTLLPIPSGQISAATLTVYGGTGNGKGIDVRRVTTNWLANAAGLNDSNVSATYSNLATSTAWSSGPFSASDYTSAGEVTNKWAGAALNQPLTFNVLTQVQAMYNSGNHGFALTNIDNPTTNQSNITIQNPNIAYALNTHPTLSLTYSDPGGPRTLTVNSGTGGGIYAAGTTVAIAANPATTGVNLFAGWAGATNWVWNRLAVNTNVQMPPYDITVTAAYSAVVALTVNSGTGDGQYIEGQVVAITADSPPYANLFDRWVGDTATVANVELASTTVTMPGTNVTLTATYLLNPTTYHLTVNGGSGGGDYTATAVVDIVAEAPPAGYHFDEWWGRDNYCVANVDSASTTVTMPKLPVQITARYTMGDRIKLREYLDDDPATTDVEPPEAVEEGFTKAKFDDSWVHGKDSPDDVRNPTDYLTPGAASDYSRSVFIAVKDMRNLLAPSTNGMVLTIHKAKFWWYKAVLPNGDDWFGANTNYRIASVKTDWLLQDAGLNEYEVSGSYARNSTLTTWAAGDMSPTDWTTGINEEIPNGINTVRTFPGSPWPDGYRVSIDVTAATREINASGNNYGYVLYPEDPANQGGSNAGYWNFKLYHSSETTYGSPALRPVLVIDYTYEVPHTLTVNRGTGDGLYLEGTVVSIVAGASPAGTWFIEWLGDTAYVASPHAAATTVTMPDHDVTVTAFFSCGCGPIFHLTVDSGSGDGTYRYLWEVAISADPAQEGWKFKEWAGNVATIADVHSPATTLTMPHQDCSVTATYKFMADLNEDLFVGQGDLNIVLAQWGRSGARITDPRADPSGDGFVGQADLNIVLAKWGWSPTLP